MNPPKVYMCSPSWTLLPPPSPFHPSGSSQCTSPKHPVSCIKPGLETHFIHDILHVSMPFSQIFPPSPSPTGSIRLFYTSVSLLEYLFVLLTNDIVVWMYHICLSIHHVGCFYFWLLWICCYEYLWISFYVDVCFHFSCKIVVEYSNHTLFIFKILKNSETIF